MPIYLYIFYYLIFPGFAFAVILGLMAGWVDRKVTARIHWRQGPPWYQNFVDIIKLFSKEVIIPDGASYAFLLAPLLGLLAASLAAATVGVAFIDGEAGFVGDLIVLFYLLAIPALALIMGASSSRNPLASIGAGREIKMLLGYELPIIIILLTVIVRSDGSIRLGEIIQSQAAGGSYIASLSGLLGFIVGVLCIQAKLGFVPFDAAEAEQEIMGGAYIEYSGGAYALFKLTEAVMLYTLPLFLILLFWAGSLNPLALIGKYVVILVLIILIKNTNPRLKVGQALRFFWGPVTLLALLSLILAFMGF